MQTINFIYKVKLLTNKSGEKTTSVKVYDCLQNRTVIKNFEGIASFNEISHWMQTSKEFDYKHFQVYFVDASLMKF